MDESSVRRDFDEFVRGHWTSLMSIGMAITGSRVEAEDLVQTALTNAWPRWRRIRPEQALAYLRRSILNANVSRWRRHRGAEVFVALPPERPQHGSPADGVDDRSVLLPALRALPPRQRAVLVLRYLCDLPDAEVAATLDISPATVRTQAMRGLAALRRQPMDETTPEHEVTKR